MEKIKLLFIVILTIPAFRTMSQTVIAGSGGFSLQPNYSVAWTLGESITASLSNSNTMLTQGFHQVSGTVVGIEQPDNDLNFRIYPNPFAEHLSIQISEANQLGYSYRISDLTGQTIVADSPLNQTYTDINLSNLAPGVYLITISNSTNRSSYRIIKTN
ncbi:MAG: T9SS type A sorting domain-containing protein [Bacteroidia bacterium]|nr:T9SS type A sorting domain-containing protein [Bacteroidia bacterium]